MRIGPRLMFLLLLLPLTQAAFAQSAAPPNAEGHLNGSPEKIACQVFGSKDAATNYMAAAEEAAKADPPAACLAQYLNETTIWQPNKESDRKKQDEEAIQLLHTAISKGEAAWGSDSPQLLPFFHALHEQIFDLRPKDENAQEETVYTRVLEIIEKAYGPEDGRLVPPLQDLANEYRNDAEDAYDRCVSGHERAPDGDTDQCATVRAQAYQKCEPLLLRAVKIAQDDPTIALQAFEASMGRDVVFHRADKSETDSLAPMKASESPLSQLAVLYTDEGNFTQAETTYQQLAAIDDKLYGSISWQSGTTWLWLADAYRQQGDGSQAESYFHLALNVARQLPSDAQPWPNPAVRLLVRALNNLAQLSFQKGQIDEGRGYLQQALDGLVAYAVSSSPSSTGGLTPFGRQWMASLNAGQMTTIGDSYRAAGLNDDALTVYLQTLAMENTDPANRMMAFSQTLTLRSYAELLRQTNRADDAAAIDAQAKALSDKLNQQLAAER